MITRFAFALLLLLPFASHAQDAQTILHLLDYIGVDYPEAVEDGKVKNADEYKEMLEFTAQVNERLKTLPENASKPALLTQAQEL